MASSEGSAGRARQRARSRCVSLVLADTSVWAREHQAQVAAMLAVAFVLMDRPADNRRAATAGASYALIGDVTLDGRVDIRDALALARRIEGELTEASPGTDVNADRLIDRKDVDAIAMMAVKLSAARFFSENLDTRKSTRVCPRVSNA